MTDTKIEWADKVWNPVIGCTAVSPGCANCYAVSMAHRHASNPKLGDTYHGLTVKHPNGIVGWSGQVKCLSERLKQPLRWKQPSRIFVNSMSDIFHPDVPDKFIDKVFAVMAQAQHHVFQVLTKRPQRMREYFSEIEFRTEMVGIQAEHISGFDRFIWHDDDSGNADPRWPFPLKNVWLGTSVENQATADERIPLLLQTPAAVHWISAEPLLGPVTIGHDYLPSMESFGNTLDWVVCGGESGPNARPMHPDWARGLRDQCKAADVPFFFKQWGEWSPYGKFIDTQHGKEMTREWTGGGSVRVGKTKAGCLLDGVEHKEFPQ